MNRLFVAYKPAWIGSNRFLSQLKRKYSEKKAGFSGTLDPFAKGVLIIGLGTHTKLFRFLDKTPKTYRATLWLGAHSDSLDIELVDKIEDTKPLSLESVHEALKNIEGTLTYEPPIFSAKKIDGQRAYDLARAGKEVILNKITSTIYATKFISYCHPFITFEATVSEGTYIRSLGRILANTLGIKDGSLTALERLYEGQFFYENEKALDIKRYLNIPQNFYLGDLTNIFFGKPLHVKDFQIRENGTYWIDNNDTITIVSFSENQVKYELNKVEVC
ncbi:MAG: tRNA pseudouridine(55) synthase TruB [Thiovulaceae bacterium]|nr:tRNA pseudouridine(55) synthase TruB [Sulfurimonadaceae bacterium]